MGNYVPLLYSIGIIMILSLGLNLILDDFVDTSVKNPDSSVGNSTIYENLINATQTDSLIYFYETGWEVNLSIFGFALDIPTFNVFYLLGSDVQDEFEENLIQLTYIPDEILLPLFVLIFISLIYGIIKIVLP